MDPVEAIAINAVFFAIVIAILGLAKILSDNRTKTKLIEARPSEEMVRALFGMREDRGIFSALKWGLVVVGVGLGLVVVQVFPADFSDPIAYGFLFLFGGSGLLAYYLIASRRARKDAGGESDPPD